jgi:probable rRNA maturation factor
MIQVDFITEQAESGTDLLPHPEIADQLRRAVKTTLADQLPGIQNSDYMVELSITLCDDPHIQKLNARHRETDQATNVLSFAQSDMPAADTIAHLRKFLTGDLGGDIYPLGDIVISWPTVMREAKAQDKSVMDHATHLVIHALLHLLGYHHNDEEAQEKMESLEIRLCQKFDIDNPYLLTPSNELS